MELDTAIVILKDMIQVNKQIIIPGEELSDLDRFQDRQNKAIEITLWAAEQWRKSCRRF